MQLSYQTIQAIIERAQGNGYWDTASEYGEPGYSTSGDTPLVVLGDYWCRCGKNPHAGLARYGGQLETLDGLHDHGSHHPRIWSQREAQGVQFEWCDEWVIDHEGDKAYRTQGDSYEWQPSALFTEYGDLLTPDSDIEEWIAEMADNPSRCLLGRVHSPRDLEAVGFERWPDDDTDYESGWHPGQTDDPAVILERIRAEHPDDTVVFMIVENSQFYSKWAAFRRPQEVNA